MGSSLCCSRDVDGICCSNMSQDRPVAITFSPSNANNFTAIMRLKRNGPSGYNEFVKSPKQDQAAQTV